MRCALSHHPAGIKTNVAHSARPRNNPRYCSLKTSQPTHCGALNKKKMPASGKAISMPLASQPAGPLRSRERTLSSISKGTSFFSSLGGSAFGLLVYQKFDDEIGTPVVVIPAQTGNPAGDWLLFRLRKSCLSPFPRTDP